MNTEIDLTKFKVNDLKKMCKDRGLSITGSKAELVQKINEYDSNKALSEAELLLSEDTTEQQQQQQELQTQQQQQQIQHQQQLQTQKQQQQQQPKTIQTTQIINNNNNAINNINNNINNVKTDHQINNKLEELTTESINKPKLNKIEAPPTAETVEKQKIEQRMKRFGVVNEDSKKSLRANRFGTNNQNGVPTDEKLKKRAERFNLQTSGQKNNPEINNEIAEKRKRRFGIVSSESQDDKLNKRKQKFGTPQDPDLKKQKRADRFGLKVN